MVLYLAPKVSCCCLTRIAKPKAGILDALQALDPQLGALPDPRNVFGSLLCDRRSIPEGPRVIINCKSSGVCLIQSLL